MNRKGMSMISLVIVIIVTIILVGIATTAGYRYITQVNNVRAQALGDTVGSAAHRRQKDVSFGVATSFYEGYLFDFARADFSKIEYLPEEDEDGDGIPDVLQEEGAMWYLFDAESSANLGVGEAERFLTRNITYYEKPGLDEEQKNELCRLVLADYSTGTGYYVRMPATVALDAIGNAIGNCPNSPTGNHKFTVATCTEPSICIYGCGTINHDALGHDWVESTCTEAGYCARCGIENPDDPAKGHLFISNGDVTNTELIEILAKRDSYMVPNLDDPDKAWVADANKHWHECVRCGERFEEEVHDRVFLSKDEKTHQDVCSICGWESVVSLHKIKFESVTDNTHRVWCEACMFGDENSTGGIVIHDDTGWLDGNPNFHYRICEHTSTDYCNLLEIELETGDIVDVIFKEPHYDYNGDFICDACGRNTDNTPPPDFGYEDYGSYARVKEVTTCTATVEAFTIDQETSVDHYNFGILKEDGTIEWTDDIFPSDPSQPATYTFTGLKPDTEYHFFVRATDTTGNKNNVYEFTGRTAGFPEFNGLRGVPNHYVKGPYDIGLNEIDTDLPELSVVMKQNDGTWSDPIPLDDIPSLVITLNEETEVLQFKFRDEAGNESEVTTYTVRCIDATPPVVEIKPKEGDDNTTSALYHQATIIVSDDKSGIDTHTLIRYGWSTSDSTPPPESELQTIFTPNLEIAESVSVDVVTPEGLNGDYYLWVMRGIEDVVGNPTTEDYVSPMKFTIDDEQARLSNIKMLNLNPPNQVRNEHLFVKNGGTVTISFTSDKVLRRDPIVRLNGVDVTDITHSGKNYTCRVVIDPAIYDEGTLQLYIGDVMSENGRVSNITYDNDDIVSGQGPVYYDRTLPVLDYIPKNVAGTRQANNP